MPLRTNGRILAASLAVLAFLSACSEKKQHPVDRVIGSFSDSLPRIPLPADADTADAKWAGIDLEPKTPVRPLYPEESAKKFLLPPGYRMEPVLTEPEIEQPGAIAFDGNGRMYVLELRTYMLTADSDGELDPVSRISRWEDTDDDGIYDRGTVFVDSLVFPRFVLPYGKDCILAMESNQDNVYRYTDTDGDGKADRKELFTNRYGRAGNVEHQQAFMYYGMDNWLYSTVNAFRVRETAAGVIREPTGYNRAQWGLTHDDDGKLWFLGGASGVPSYFQFPIHYGNFEVPGELAEGFEVPWGAPVGVADMQGGMDHVRKPDGSLNRVTGAAGNDIYRGDRLPRELYGELFYGEPVARIVRRIHPEVQEGLTTLHNAYQPEKSEFLRSLDPLFRPVDLTTAPDGTLYVTDMYRGIIQEGQWVQPGSYLRAKIEQYQLDKVVGLGRIWRITHDSLERDRTRPDMLDKEPAELVAYLGHPNGWWRDKAQQLIVLSGDKSLGPELQGVLWSDANPNARIHALWCLEGLGLLKEEQVRRLAADDNPRIRIQALRAGEGLVKAGATSLEALYAGLMQDADTDVALQAMLSSSYLELDSLEARVSNALESSDQRGIQLVGTQILEGLQEGAGGNSHRDLDTEQIASLERGAVIYNELCIQCHGAGGLGKPAGNGRLMAPPLASSIRVQDHPRYALGAILHGLQGSIDGKDYAGGIMVGNREQTDQWIADITSFIRREMGNGASLVTAEEVAEFREDTGNRGPYEYPELLASIPRELKPDPSWKMAASHTQPVVIGGSASPAAAFDFGGWTTGVDQQEGMWYRIDFPDPVSLYEIQFDAPANGTVWAAAKKPAAYPRELSVQASDDGQTWREITRVRPDSLEVAFKIPPTRLRALRLELTDTPDEPGIPWSMRRMRLYGQQGNMQKNNPKPETR
ncbi:discoidin domain-containing protein [Robiginitalea sp. SC105]|uniref:DUF7133 domain-containing protein n=1 Tax=Robiginitalea sp. SC105 TaxID=2762332 RepID=UPI00163A5F64|nr:discoidin domain-containing protein [Robiginitalea sp. SC105]MBC2838642.1 discoidin domain-containing protein [Robiginitalea sp. SC105]